MFRITSRVDDKKRNAMNKVAGCLNRAMKHGSSKRCLAKSELKHALSLANGNCKVEGRVKELAKMYGIKM